MALREGTTMYPWMSLNDFTVRQALFAERFAITREAGFSGIEFQIEEAREYAKEHGGLDSVSELLRRNSLRFDQALMLRECLSSTHQKERDAFLNEAERVFRDTKVLGGKTVLACATFGKSDLKAAPELFAELCDLAATIGISLALEFIGWAETIKDIRTALEIVERAGRKNGGIYYDTLQHQLGGSTLRDLEELPTEYIYGVHLADARNLNLPPMEIGRKHRLFPGEGDVPINEIVKILHVKGYRSCFALEIFNDEYMKRPALDVAREGFDSMAKVLSTAGYK